MTDGAQQVVALKKAILGPGLSEAHTDTAIKVLILQPAQAYLNSDAL